MNPFDYIKTLDHHAYFIHSFKDGVDRLKEYLKERFNIHYVQNPDFYHEKFEVLGIDESRKIKEYHNAKSFKEDDKRIFIIEADGMTHEAQNSLLKIFEEPHTNNHFFIFMPSSEALLPTLLSRLFIARPFQNMQDKNVEKEMLELLRLSKKERVDFVDDIAKKISDEELSKIDAIGFLDKLELFLYKNGIEKNQKALKAILKARDYIGDRSASVKQLLEYVMLNIR